jgi:hypothetical protein
MALKLPKQAFLALAAVVWSDDTIKKSEAGGLVRAAKECGLAGDDLAAVEGSMKKRVTVDDFEPGDMTEWDRVLTYAVASWLAQLDGVVTTEENDTLAKLGEKLGVSVGTRKRATSAAFDIAVLPEGGRPDRYDFDKLATRIKEKMPQLAK